MAVLCSFFVLSFFFIICLGLIPQGTGVFNFGLGFALLLFVLTVFFSFSLYLECWYLLAPNHVITNCFLAFLASARVLVVGS